jgi:hypothetical protein
MPFSILPLLLCCSSGAAEPVATLAIKAGESIVFVIEEDGPVAVRSGGSPGPGQLAARLTVGHGRTFLEIVNNSGRWLNYHASMAPVGEKPRRTAVCTLRPDNEIRRESWPKRLRHVTVFSFESAKPGEFSCE